MENINYINKSEFIKTFNQQCPEYQYIPAILPKVPRIVVFGDIHGDYNLMIDLLKMSNVIDSNHNWIGGNTYVVQVGDQVDRCRPLSSFYTCANPQTTQNDEANDINILKYFNQLHDKAKVYGGAVISLLGNHEIMNSLGDMSYVSYEGIKQFANKDIINTNDHIEIVKSGTKNRKEKFAPGNEYGTLLGCSRIPSVIIGSNLFVHAGIVDYLLSDINIKDINDLETINMAIRYWLLGIIDKRLVEKILLGNKSTPNTSMFWTRLLGNLPPNLSFSDPQCYTYINKVLKVFKIDHIIIGHTPQSFMHNSSNGTCDDIVWRVDNGSSHAFDYFDKHLQKYGNVDNRRKPQYLEILNDTEFILHT